MDKNMKRAIYQVLIISLLIIGCGSTNETTTSTPNSIVHNARTSTLGNTGQVINYTDFDDGYYKIGIAKIYVRDDKNEVITDNSSSLMWQDNVEPTTLGVDWYEARKYCANLTLASHSDWRLPTRKELHNIVDYGKYNPSIFS